MSPDDAAPSPAALRAVALKAARTVAPALAAAFRSPGTGSDDGGPAAEAKTNHHDLVTAHDRRTEAQLVAALTAAVPGSRVLGEELGRSGGAASGGPGSGVEWIVDPIDGTSNFAHGFAMFSVSVAAAVDGEVAAGVVVDPVNGLEFSADDSGALELAYAAAGWADVALLVDTKPWDVAAGQLILRRAGGRYLTPAPERAGDAARSGPLAPDAPRPHEAAFALALAPSREAPTAVAVLEEVLASRAPFHGR